MRLISLILLHYSCLISSYNSKNPFKVSFTPWISSLVSDSGSTEELDISTVATSEAPSEITIDEQEVNSSSSKLSVVEEGNIPNVQDNIDNTLLTSPSYTKPNIPYKGLPFLLEKYKGKVVHCVSEKYPHCQIILCGSIHVTSSSSDMVEEVINELKPQFVMLELCEARVDSLIETPTQNITLIQVLQETYNTRSAKTLGMGLLSWMQVKAAKLMGSQLGGEQVRAARVGAQNNAMLVLGDRLYSTTIQRVFDKLNFFNKIKVLLVFIWEMLTMTVLKLKDYIKKSEADSNFIQNEILRFNKYFPEIATTIINERDEYMAQTLCEIARVGFGPGPYSGPCYVVAVVGAGHMPGLQRWVQCGGISEERLFNISTSSKQPESCWPGRGSLHIVNKEGLYPDLAARYPTVASSSQYAASSL